MYAGALTLILSMSLLAACGSDGGSEKRGTLEESGDEEVKEKEKDKDKEEKDSEKPGKEEKVQEEPVEEPAEEEPAEEPEPTEEPEPVALEETELMGYLTQDMNGKEMTLGDLVRENDLTMINIWGTFCGPCINEMPDLAEIAEEYADRGFGIVGLACDVTDWDGNLDPEMAQEAKDIAQSTGVKYPLAVETEEMAAVLDTGYVPTTYFVDRAGNILTEEIVGSQSKAEWEKTIEKLLKQVGR